MGSRIRAGHPHAPTRVVLSPAKDPRLPAAPSPKAKAHCLPIPQDPSLPTVDQDDPPPWERRPRRERSPIPAPASHRPGGGPPTRPTPCRPEPAKDPRLPAPTSPKAKAHSLPIAQDPSLPLVDQDDTKRDAQNHCVVLSLVLSEAEVETKDPGLPTPNRPYLLEHSATESKTLNHSGYSFGSNTSSRHDCAWRRARMAL